MKKFKWLTVVTLIVFILSVGTPAFAATPEESAQKLVDSLKTMGLDEVDYLYAYLQSVEVSDSEFDQIVANADQASALIDGVSDASQLTTANKMEAFRLFSENAQLAKLDFTIVDADGNPVNFQNFNFDLGNKGILIDVKDLEGNSLGVVDVKRDLFDPSILSEKINALETAVDAKIELDKTGEFVPMPSAELPDTSAELLVNLAVIGTLLVVIGAFSFIPAVRWIRKQQLTTEV